MKHIRLQHKSGRNKSHCCPGAAHAGWPMQTVVVWISPTVEVYDTSVRLHLRCTTAGLQDEHTTAVAAVLVMVMVVGGETVTPRREQADERTEVGKADKTGGRVTVGTPVTPRRSTVTGGTQFGSLKVKVEVTVLMVLGGGRH